MKHLLTLLLVVSSISPALAAPPRDAVSAEAKWLLHLDLVEMRAAQVGAFALTIVQAKLAGVLAEVGQQVNLTLDAKKVLGQINAITVYGTDYESSNQSAVALVRTEPELQQIVVGALAGMVLNETNNPPRIQEKRQGEITFYVIKDKGAVAVLPGKAIIIGKSQELTEKAAQVLVRKSPNLASTKTFSNFAEVKRTFFFLAVGEGFNTGSLPPQARLLQLADGGRLALGEKEKHVFLDLALQAKTSEIVTQMQQVVQGVIAFGSLGQPENKDLTHVLQSIKVSSDKNVVNVTLDYPAEQLIQELGKTRANRKAKAKTPDAEQPE